MMLPILLLLVAVATANTIPKITPPRFNTNSGNQRIVGGPDAAVDEFPWQASLQDRGRHFCGGSLIDKKFVMTAAHCYMSSVTVGLGSIYYNNSPQTINVISFTKHPQYVSFYDYDFAIIELASDAALSSSVKVIELVAEETNYPGGMMASTSGWGYDTRFNQAIPQVLNKADIPLVSKDDCSKIWGSVITINDRIQCAGGDGTASSCNGDSGGPLTVKDNGVDILIGAVSWVESTCNPAYPGGYAKITAVRAWVDTILEQP